MSCCTMSRWREGFKFCGAGECINPKHLMQMSRTNEFEVLLRCHAIEGVFHA